MLQPDKKLSNLDSLSPFLTSVSFLVISGI